MKIPGTPFETLARTGAPEESGSRSRQAGMFGVITHCNIWDKVSKRVRLSREIMRNFPSHTHPSMTSFQLKAFSRKGNYEIYFPPLPTLLSHCSPPLNIRLHSAVS